MANPTNRPKRTRLSPAARRSQLLEIGLQLLLNEPLDNLTVDRVASEAGVSRGLVFHYFPSVRELHLAALAEAATVMATAVGDAAVHVEADERLRRGLDAFIGYIEQWPRTFLAMSNYAARDDDFGEIFEDFRVQMVDLIVERAGIPRDPLIALLLRSWVSFTESAVLQWIDERPVPRDELIELLVKVKNDLQDHWRSHQPAGV